LTIGSHIIPNLPAMVTGPIVLSQILFFASIMSSSIAWIAPIALLTTAFIVLIIRPRFQFFLFLIFVLICWFPEFSQTEWDVHSAEDAPSLYNYRLIPGIAASGFDYLFAAIVVVWVLKYVLPNPRKILKAPFARVILAFFAVWVLNFLHGLFRGNEAYYALREFRVGAYFVLTYMMMVTVSNKAFEVWQFIKLNLVMAGVVGIYGVLRYFLGFGKEFADVVIVYYDIADSMVLYMAMFFVISFGIEGLLKRGKMLLTIVLMFPIVFTFLFSYRRGAWVAFSAGLMFLVAFYPHLAHLRRWAIRRALVAAALIIALVATVPAVRGAGLDFVLTRVSSIFDISGDLSNAFRVLDSLNALNTFAQHPLIGVGAGGRYDLEFTSEQSELMAFMEEVSKTSHDGYLYVLFKTGFIGFMIYILVFAKFVRRWFQVRKMVSNSIERAVFMALGAIVVAFLVNNITEPVSDTLRPSLLLAFAMAWGATWMRGLSDRAAGSPLTVASHRTSDRISGGEPGVEYGN
jgi:O-antigen ligase